ncbi:MAG: acetate--CoA ligase family protein [Pirellulaceae bacterium]|nr:acetate--CoA ligase family protein [Pirellulaceae bacterium]
MRAENLLRMLAPQSIAVIGASDTPSKVGFTLLQNLVRGGFLGRIYPVNKQHSRVQDLDAYPSVAALPVCPELAIVCTPAVTVPQIIRECGEKGVAGVLILTAGFRESGPAGALLEQDLRSLQQTYPAMRIVGPNCLGMICPWNRMNASFAVGMPKPGSVAFLSQSGALCTAVLDWAIAQDVGFSQFISLGNQLDVGFADLLEMLADDPRTTAAILYIESIADANYFLKAAQKFALQKPIVAAKSGRFTASAKAAASHTGAMAGVDAVYQAAFQRAGIVRVFDMESMFECVELLTQHPQVVGSRLAIVTNAGGPGVMATDALLANRGQLADLSTKTIQTLNSFLPAAWSHGNPVDVLGDADAERFVRAAQIVLQDENVDTILAILTPQSMTQPTHTAKGLSAIVCPPGKAIISSWMGGEQMREGRHFLRASRIPTFDTPEQAIGGLMHLSNYARVRESLTRENQLMVTQPSSHQSHSSWLQDMHFSQETTLSQFDSKRVLSDYQVPVTRILSCSNIEEAIAAAKSIGFPLVAKIQSPQITHKTEVQGVALNLKSETEVQAAYERLVRTAQELRPDAIIEGVTIEPMISMVNSIELILGAKRDAVFGPVIMVGYGGIAAELFKDRTLELPPISPKLALRMLQSLRCWPLLEGYRGKPPMDIEQLCEIIVRLAALVTEQTNILEIDINPLLVSTESIIAVDARIVMRG